jgi:hypothetical protein
VVGVQMPSCPGKSQRSHVPQAYLSQHTPSVQYPLLHCHPPVQVLPRTV